MLEKDNADSFESLLRPSGLESSGTAMDQSGSGESVPRAICGAGNFRSELTQISQKSYRDLALASLNSPLALQ